MPTEAVVDRGPGARRRTVLAGAAWSVPVIVAATSSPALAATYKACPDKSTSASWTFSDNGHVGSGNGFNTEDGKNVFKSQADNTSNSQKQQNGEVYLKTTLDVEAGRTYTFTYDAYANYGNYDKSTSTDQYFDVEVDGSRISTYYGTRTEKDGNEQLPIRASASDARPWKTYSSSYTATETKQVTLTFKFTLSYMLTGTTRNDDITVQLPVITCSS